MRASLFTLFSLCFYLKNSYAGVEGEWLRVSHGQLPERAFITEDQQLICRAPHSKGIYPGYISHGACILNVAGREVKAIHYEVLLAADYKWQVFSRTYTEKIPPTAVIGGTEDPQSDRVLYICRAKLQPKEWIIGKLSHPLRGCQLNHHNREQSRLDFEILVTSE